MDGAKYGWHGARMTEAAPEGRLFIITIGRRGAMPIEITGASSGKEREAGQALREILDEFIGPTRKLLIVVGAQCLGEEVQDIDLLLLGSFGTGIDFRGSRGEARGHEVRLVNICVIIEVKDHTGSRVKFDSQHVSVHRYSAGRAYWEDATDKVLRQRVALRSFLKRHNQPEPYVGGLIWLRNYDGDIPTAAENVLGRDLSSNKFLRALEEIRPPKLSKDGPQGKGFYIAFTGNTTINAIRQAAGFFRPIVTPTELDRRRTEHIIKKLIAGQRYVERLGN
jgi:hypothetical protein